MTDTPKNLDEALALLQARLPRIKKDTTGQYGKYADLADVSLRLLPIMAGLGLSFSSKPTLVTREDGTRDFVLLYTLRHVSGERDQGEYPLSQAGFPQQLGSAITYARRYTLTAITGAVADTDDDAEGAQQGARDRAPIVRQRKIERARGPQDGDDKWASVNGNGERQEQGALPVREAEDRGLTTDIVRHFRRLGLGAEHDREERLGMTMTLAGIDRVIETTGDLTQDEGRRVRNKLERCKNEMALRDLVAAEHSARPPAQTPGPAAQDGTPASGPAAGPGRQAQSGA